MIGKLSEINTITKSILAVITSFVYKLFELYVFGLLLYHYARDFINITGRDLMKARQMGEKSMELVNLSPYIYRENIN